MLVFASLVMLGVTFLHSLYEIHIKMLFARKRLLKWSAIAFLGLLLVGFAVFSNVWWFKPFSINIFYERVFFKAMLDQPELISQLGIPVLNDWYQDELTDVSEVRQAARREQVKKDLETLRSYDRGKQSPGQLLSTDILAWFLDNLVSGQQFAWHDYPVNQLSGVQSNLPSFMDSAHTVRTDSDAAAYISRLSKFGTKFDQVLESLYVREEKNIIPPRFVIDRVVKEMNAFVFEDVEENILWFSFRDKLAVAEQVSNKPALLAKAKAEIRKTVFPAYYKLIDYFEELRSKSSTDDGVWRLPRGDEYYAWCLRNHTTTSMTPEQVHQLGLSEVERILAETRTVLESIERSDTLTVAEHFRELGEDPQHQFDNTDEGRTQCIAEYNRLLDELGNLADVLFQSQPKSQLTVRRIPEFKEATAPLAYYEPPAMDGSREGVFFVRLINMGDMPRWTMHTLAAHEGIPGHHFQLAIAMELEGVPTFRKVLPFTAFAEGWALYTERLVWEHGFYDEDPFGNLGRLRDELFRAVRLVVDTGIHHKRWTREEAIDYMVITTGMPESDVVAEVERYIVDPGQACAYKVGMIKILELRERAKGELGDKFDLVNFHEMMLKNGSVPLDILERLVDSYVESQR